MSWMIAVGFIVGLIRLELDKIEFQRKVSLSESVRLIERAT